MGILLVLYAGFLVVTFLIDWMNRNDTDRSRWPMILCSIGTVVAAVLLLLIILQNADSRALKVIAALLAVATLVPAYAALQDVRRMRLPGRIELAAALAAVVGIGSFAYTQLYEPSAQSIGMNIKAELGDAVPSPDGSSVSVPLTLTLQNYGKLEVYVAGVAYAVLGRKASLAPGGVSPEGQVENFSWDEQTTQVLIEGFSLIQSDLWLGADGGWLSPGQEIVAKKVVRIVEPVEFDEIAAAAHGIVARRDRLIFHVDMGQNKIHPSTMDDGEVPNWVHEGNDVPFMRYKASIKETDGIRDVLRGDRRLTWWMLLKDNEMTSLQWAVTREGHPHEGQSPPSPEEDLDLYDRYGLTNLWTSWTELRMR